jgi:hypothetical protein
MKRGRANDRSKTAPATIKDGWAAAAAYGCDMDLLEASLRRTPAERIDHHAKLLAAMEVDMGQTSSNLQDMKLLLRLLT